QGHVATAGTMLPSPPRVLNGTGKISEKIRNGLDSLIMTIHALGPFRLDTRGEVLLLGDEPVALGRRAVALLRVLIGRPRSLGLKDALMEAAWPGQVVEDSNLTVQIAALRRALGAVPGGDAWIETRPRRGYRFVGPLVTEEREHGIGTAPTPVPVPQARGAD